MGDMVRYEDFSKLDLRVAKVIQAEKVPGSKKLVRLIVDLGGEKRQIIAGLAKWYSPEYFVGKHVIIVANLEPKKLMGLESQGMLLAAPCSGGSKPVLLTVAEPVEPGSKVC